MACRLDPRSSTRRAAARPPSRPSAERGTTIGKPVPNICAACGARLFGSDSKYDAGSGWPSFFQPLIPAAVTSRDDNSHGMQRIEACCAHCDSHLGHVFPAGPRPTGLRYRINSLALAFEVAG